MINPMSTIMKEVFMKQFSCEIGLNFFLNLIKLYWIKVVHLFDGKSDALSTQFISFYAEPQVFAFFKRDLIRKCIKELNGWK